VFVIISSGVLKGVNVTQLLSSNIMTFVDMWMYFPSCALSKWLIRSTERVASLEIGDNLQHICSLTGVATGTISMRFKQSRLSCFGGFNE
jgi:hypothetical protein